MCLREESSHFKVQPMTKALSPAVSLVITSYQCHLQAQAFPFLSLPFPTSAPVFLYEVRKNLFQLKLMLQGDRLGHHSGCPTSLQAEAHRDRGKSGESRTSIAKPKE